jgi:hypothetical protein
MAVMNALPPALVAMLRGVRDLLVRFLLPLLALGLLLTLIEWSLGRLGVHGDIIKWLRMAVIPLYLVIAVAGSRKRPAKA